MIWPKHYTCARTLGMVNRVLQECTLTRCTLQCLVEILRIIIGHVVHTCLAVSSHVHGCQEMRKDRSLAHSGPCHNFHTAHELASLRTSLVHNIEPFATLGPLCQSNRYCSPAVVAPFYRRVPVLNSHCERHVSGRSI